MLRSLAITSSLAATVAASACGGGKEAPQGPSAPALDVRVAAVESRQINDVFEAGGVVAAQTTATVAARIMAPVREVRVQPGDRVRSGQVLVVLDDRDLSAGARQATTARDAASEGASAASAALEGARAQLALAKASHDRIVKLRERNSATAQEFDQAVAALRGAEAHLAAAEAQVGGLPFKLGDQGYQVDRGAGTGRAGDEIDAAASQPGGSQDLLRHADLAQGIGGERDADGAADAVQQQGADADGRADAAGEIGAGLGHAQVQGVREAAVGQAVGLHRLADVVRLE